MVITKKITAVMAVTEELTTLAHKPRSIQLKVDDHVVSIPVDASLFVNFQNQFKRNTKDQQKRYATLINLVRSAYQKGIADGARS